MEKILTGQGLDYVIDHETVLITSDQLERAMHSFVYPVGDLIDAATEVSGADADTAFENLMHTIRTTIAPGSWDESGGAASLTPFTPSRVLICSQTEPTQAQVETLLVQLRAAYRAIPAAASATPPQPIAVLKSYELAAESANTRPAGDPSPGEQYAALIRNVIEPKSWTDGTASVSVVPGAVVVRATPAVQARVRRVLEHVGALKVAEKKDSAGAPSTGISGQTPAVSPVPTGSALAAAERPK